MARKHDRPAYSACVANEGCDDLTLRRLYRVLPDATAEHDGYWRVVDDSGEDYLYPSDNFLPVKLAQSVTEKLRAIEPLATTS